MDPFMVQGGHFWLEGKPAILQAGEFHYFRCAPQNWRHRLGLLKDAGFNAVATYMPWRWHEMAEGVFDFDGHTEPKRDLAGFLDLAAELGLWIIARPGPYIMAETTNEGIPDWVLSGYPQTAFVSQEGKTHNIVSYLHPDFLCCVSAWYRAIFQVLAPRQVTRGGRIVMTQLDNEMGMMMWVRNIIDTNSDTLARLAAWLRAAYPAEELAERYPAVDLAGFLREGILRPEAPHGARIVEDYRRFYRDYLREYAAWLWAEARACGLETPPVANIHGFGNGGKTFPIGLSQLVEVLRLPGMIGATDVYPLHIDEGNIHQLLLVNEMTKALQDPEQALFSIEFQAGGNADFSGCQASLYDLHTRLCLSVGMRAVNHYLFANGENDPLLSPVKRHDWGHPIRKDGTVRRHYARYGKLSAVLGAYGEELARARPQTVTTIGFTLDTFMTEVNTEQTREASNILTHQRDVVLFDLIARGLTLTHRPFDAIDLDRAALDPAQTPLLWAAMDRQCDAATQAKLAEYARQGGRLALVGRMCVEDWRHRPCTVLKDALGLGDIASDPPFTGTSIRAFDHSHVPASFMEAYTGELGEVFATRGDGQAVGFVKAVGAGRVMMLGAALAANTLEDLDIVEQMALKMGCPRLFALSDWADVRLSRGPATGFLYIANYQDDPVETTIDLAGERLLGGHAVVLPARRGLILPLEWQPRPGVTVHYLTSEVTAIEEDGATLTLRAAQDECYGEVTVGRERRPVHTTDGALRLRR